MVGVSTGLPSKQSKPPVVKSHLELISVSEIVQVLQFADAGYKATGSVRSYLVLYLQYIEVLYKHVLVELCGTSRGGHKLSQLHSDVRRFSLKSGQDVVGAVTVGLSQDDLARVLSLFIVDIRYSRGSASYTSGYSLGAVVQLARNLVMLCQRLGVS